MKKKERFQFSKCMAMMRSRDGLTSEEGFQSILPHAREHVSELVAELHAENNRGLRCWLLELLVVARAAEALPVFAESLKSDHDSQRIRAIKGLAALATPEARALLWDARSYTFKDAEETAAFREDLRTYGPHR